MNTKQRNQGYKVCILFTLFIAFSLSLVLPNFILASEEDSYFSKETASPEYEKLFRKAQTEGQVRVIVGLKTSFTPEGKMLTTKEVSEQRIRISQLQESLLKSLKITDERHVKKYKYTPFIALEVDEATLQSLINSPLISSIEEDRLLRLQLWNSVPLIGANSGEANTYTGAGQTIAILDTGVDDTHPFLVGKVVEEACFSDTDSVAGSTSLCPNGQSQEIGSGAGINCSKNINDDCKHGTHVAGIAAGKRITANDGIHVLRGVAPDANIIVIQVFSLINDKTCSPNPSCVESYPSDQKLALEHVYSLRNTFNIASVNLSIGGQGYTTNCDNVYPALKADIDNLRSVGIATVVASGNETYNNAIDFPACISSAISVGATEHYGFDGIPEQLAPYSNSASFLSLLAPGGCDPKSENVNTCGIYSSVPPEWGYWGMLSGTSMATPHVAGAWAMLKQKNPSASVDQILAVLQSTGKPFTDTRIGADGTVTYITKPRIQVDAALDALPALPAETISTPVTPSGTTNGIIDMSYPFATGGSMSNLGHSVQYLFDWGDGSNSGWLLPVGNTAASHSWASPGMYSVKAQARCATENSVVSGWSSALTITIVAPIALQLPSDNTPFDACSLYSLPGFSWIVGDTFKSYELQFSTDQSFSSIPVRVKLSTIGTQINANIWKKVLMIPGTTGGTVSWRVVGKRPDKTIFTSEAHSLIIESPNAVENPNISPTSKSSLPTLSWVNNCNVKFKVWFGNDSDFTMKKALPLSLRNPEDNGGTFSRQLTSGQWKSVRKLVGDMSGSAIYWYIEAWDGLKRYSRTDLMNFTLID